MADIKLDYMLLTALSAFTADARKEGFSFKPSQIVRDKQYCSEVVGTLLAEGSEALTASGLSIINRCHNLPEAKSFIHLREQTTPPTLPEVLA